MPPFIEVIAMFHIVQPGDCVWNIAKKRLQDRSGQAPNDAEIAQETNRIVQLNKLDEPPRHRDLIYPGEKLVLE